MSRQISLGIGLGLGIRLGLGLGLAVGGGASPHLVHHRLALLRLRLDVAHLG